MINSDLFSTRHWKLSFTRETGVFTGGMHISYVAEQFDHQGLVSLLTFKERTLLDSFATLQRRRSFLLGRYIAKLCAAAHFEVEDMSAIEVLCGVFGQPLLHIPGVGNTGISITHKGNYFAAVVFNSAHPIGLDIESISNGNYEILCQQMSAAELDAARFCGIPGHIYITALWSAKEALSKILQCGLTVPFQLLAVSNTRLNDETDLTGEFLHFHQYRFKSFVKKSYVFTLVYPRKSHLDMPHYFKDIL